MLINEVRALFASTVSTKFLFGFAAVHSAKHKHKDMVAFGGAPAGVAVVVLGDVGRSPRMQYHAASLAGAGVGPVTLIGLAGEACQACVADDPRITQRLLSPPWALTAAPRVLWPLVAPLKVIWQCLALLWSLLALAPAPRVVLVQTPPAIPTLAVAWFAARVRGARLVIDWHNFGFTVLGLSLRSRYGARGASCARPLLRVALKYERFCAGLADAHFCVTNAMRLWLRKHWRVHATVLYDRPPPFFRRASAVEKHDLFSRLASELPTYPGASSNSSSLLQPSIAATTALTELYEIDSGNAAPLSSLLSTRRRTASRSPSPPANELRNRRSLSRRTRGSGESPSLSLASSAWASLSPVNDAAVGGGALYGSARGGFGPPSPPAADDSASVSTLSPASAVTMAEALAAAGLGVRERRGRPAVIVSSTSWTEDEDFGIFFGALAELDAVACREPTRYPDFLVLVTGRGPLRKHYEALLAAQPLRRVAVRMLWLEPADYPLLLGCADLGVSLHFSTSGLDLPMKVADMFGAGLPVCAIHFDCLSELVKHDVNGLVFRTAAELGEQLCALFDGFPGGASAASLERLGRGVRRLLADRWDDNWRKRALASFL